MFRLLYTLALYLLVPFILLRLLWRAKKAPAYKKRWGERFGLFTAPQLKPKVIWIHAVSVGESLAAIPLIQYLLEHKSQYSLVVTTTTPTGSDRIRHRFNQLPPVQLFHMYCPYDLPDCIARFLNRLKPNAFIVMETELWPNTIAACRKRNIPVLLANGRLSEKSAKGYQKVRALMLPVFDSLSAAAIQGENDAQRMLELGLKKEHCTVTGNIKFDLHIDDVVRDKAQQLRQHLQNPKPNKVLIAASTHQGEDEIVLSAFHKIKQQEPDSFLIIVPRHPERFDEVAVLIRERGFNFDRRHNHRIEAGSDVLLGDTMGEMLVLLGAADAAFIGGSLVAIGGHNLMEPAAWGLPILTGPYLYNFSEASELLKDAKALSIVESADDIAEQTLALWREEDRRKQMGEAALAVAQHNRGALEKLIRVVDNIIDQNQTS